MKSADMSKDEAEEFLATNYGTETFDQLRQTTWKDRLQAVADVSDKLDGLGVKEFGVRSCMALAILPGWKDSNFQVSNPILLSNFPWKFQKSFILGAVFGLLFVYTCVTRVV